MIIFSKPHIRHQSYIYHFNKIKEKMSTIQLYQPDPSTPFIYIYIRIRIYTFQLFIIFNELGAQRAIAACYGYSRERERWSPDSLISTGEPVLLGAAPQSMKNLSAVWLFFLPFLAAAAAAATYILYIYIYIGAKFAWLKKKKRASSRQWTRSESDYRAGEGACPLSPHLAFNICPRLIANCHRY